MAILRGPTAICDIYSFNFGFATMIITFLITIIDFYS